MRSSPYSQATEEFFRANLRLIATVTQTDSAEAEAIVQNTATGSEKTVAVGDVIGAYGIAEIHPKRILIEKKDETPMWKFLNPAFLD